jgi:transcriptional regulator with XRE-family HTH domain
VSNLTVLHVVWVCYALWLMADNLTAALSRRLRQLRTERGLSLRAVAKTAQVSPSLLSQIERGEASPSLLSLVAIADALGVRPGHLLEDPDHHEERSPVLRRDQRRVIEDRLCRREYLMHLDDPYLEVAELHLPPGGSSRPSLAAHSGRDYGIVIEGSAVAELSTRRELMQTGDYIAFGAEIPHRLVNESDHDTRLIWIIAHGRDRPGSAHRPPRSPALPSPGAIPRPGTGGVSEADRSMDPPGSPHSPTQALGIRLRELRVRRGQTLRSVAERAEVSPSLLSQIERGEASPSLLSLAAIAQALAVRPGDLLEGDEHDPHSPLIRRTQRRIIEDSQCRREYMTELDDPYLYVAELQIVARGASRPSPETHAGRDYGVVLEGQLAVELGDRRELLGVGDYIAFDARHPHRLVNDSGTPARILWVMAPWAPEERSVKP